MDSEHASFDGDSHSQLLYNSSNSPLTLNQSDQLIQNDTDPAIVSQASLHVQSHSAGAVITRIEDVFESIVDSILESRKELTIQVKRKPKTTQEATSGSTILNNAERSSTIVHFPSRSPQEARRFCALLNVLAASHEALVSGATITKRDIYYRDPDLFIKQALSDRCVDDVAFTLGAPRDSLNVVAAAKGLVSGAVKVHTVEDLVIDYSTASEGYLIPNLKQISRIEPEKLKWILVIEKEVLTIGMVRGQGVDFLQATFRTLTTSQYWKNSIAGYGLLITAKGYPDLQTRQFLNFLCSTNPKIPIFALVDFDPDGLGIMSTYKHGSMNLSHEPNTTVPGIEWLGVRSKDFLRLNRNKENQEKDPQGLMQLSARDRRIAMRMLEKGDILGEEGKEQEWRAEIQMMLMLNVKAEIQILGSGVRFEKWLEARLRAGRATYKERLDSEF